MDRRKLFLWWLAIMVTFIVASRIVVAYCPTCVCYDCVKWEGDD